MLFARTIVLLICANYCISNFPAHSDSLRLMCLVGIDGRAAVTTRVMGAILQEVVKIFFIYNFSVFVFENGVFVVSNDSTVGK